MTTTNSASESSQEHHGDGSITEAQVLEWLRDVKYPGYSRDIVSFGLVDAVEVSGGVVKVFLQISTKNEDLPKQIEQAVKERLAAVPEIQEAHISINLAKPQKDQPGTEVPKPVSIPGVDKVIAVASGKGGVGKSSVSAMLAMKANTMGLKSGFLDLDIYGPSLPMMMGINDRPKFEDKRIIPLQQNGLSLMSIGFFLEGETPLIWRGPMVAQAAKQLLTEVDWGSLDLLVVDLPPGTGDAQLTLAQQVELDGVVIVTTPQDLALLDARKGVMMFMKVGVHILGIVENMSVFQCPNCGHKTYLFGQGGGKREAESLRIPFLGEVPLDPKFREAVDNAGLQEIISSDNPINNAFDQIFEAITKRLRMSVTEFGKEH